MASMHTVQHFSLVFNSIMFRPNKKYPFCGAELHNTEEYRVNGSNLYKEFVPRFSHWNKIVESCILNHSVTCSILSVWQFHHCTTIHYTGMWMCMSPHQPSVMWRGDCRWKGGRGGVSHISGSWRLDLYPESMEWFIEDLAFSPSYDLAPRLSSCVSPVELTDRRERRGWGSGGGSKSYDGEKAWSSINLSILSGPNIPTYTSSGYPFPHVRYMQKEDR